MKRTRLLVIGAVGALLGGLTLVLSGALNFAASSGQLGITDWFFHMAARQSVTLRSAGIEVPPLDDPAMVRRGAGHYELVCAACHGSPAGPPAQLAGDLTPTPPLLVEQMEHWRPAARVFWTVKHGIKRSAMPAWPTQLRDDEVWSVVAFLERMPEMTATEYTELSGAAAASDCAGCHGEDGKGRGGAFPRLDIQSPDYLRGALEAFRAGTRASGTMMAATGQLTDAEIAELAAYYGTLAAADPPGEGPGAAIARHGIPARDIAACDSCHGAGARPDYPRLAGQHEAYLIDQLELFTTLGAVRGGPFAQVMARAVHGLTEAEIEAVAGWYARR